VDLTGQTTRSYALTSADVGGTVKLRITAANGAGSGSYTVTSRLVYGPAPAPTAAPLVSGTPTVGSVLTASPGSWSGSPTGYLYRWRRCDLLGANCIDIVGATGTTYTPTTADVGHTLRVEVIASNRWGSGMASSPTRSMSAGSDPVIAAAGDIACDSSTATATSCHQRATSDLLTTGGLAAVLALGDNQYDSGALSDYKKYFDPTWGRVKPLIKPVPGNHEYHTSGASGYFSYFGSSAGNPSKGYYSFNIGAWHLVALNANCGQVGGCGAGSPQELWLKADLAAHRALCTLAFWHEPRFSSGAEHGSDAAYDRFWRDLYSAGADVVLNGHDHDYERFAPQGPGGKTDAARGIREFVVGTGGKSHYGFGTILPTSQVRNNSVFGVLKLTLHPASYDWRFVPESGGAFTDSGTTACH
jgi:hypothetical protein